MWRSRPLRRCFALVPLCLWSLDNLSLRRDEVFLAFFHVFVSTKMCYFQKGSLFFWLPNRLSTTYLMLSGASAGIESIVAAGCWNWNTDCQRYVFVMNHPFEGSEFEFFFLIGYDSIKHLLTAITFSEFGSVTITGITSITIMVELGLVKQQQQQRRRRLQRPCQCLIRNLLI